MKPGQKDHRMVIRIGGVAFPSNEGEEPKPGVIQTHDLLRLHLISTEQGRTKPKKSPILRTSDVS